MAKEFKRHEVSDIDAKQDVKGGIAPLPSPHPVPMGVNNVEKRGIIVVCNPKSTVQAGADLQKGLGQKK